MMAEVLTGGVLPCCRPFCPWLAGRWLRGGGGGWHRGAAEAFCGSLIKNEIYLAPAGALHGMSRQKESTLMVRRKRDR